MPPSAHTLVLVHFVWVVVVASAWVSPRRHMDARSSSLLQMADKATASTEAASTSVTDDSVFDDFVSFLKDKQLEIIQQLEDLEASASSSATFSNDPWGIFDETDLDSEQSSSSGGMTRVLQNGNVIEKGACSLTMIREGVLTADRANTIRSRQQLDRDNDDDTAAPVSVQAGDFYSAAALSMVLHTKSPLIPTFRSDVRIFVVRSNGDDEGGDSSTTTTLAWFGGGADLTPYYLDHDDIRCFHEWYRDLCKEHLANEPDFTYQSMKEACDDYFYLPARREHRGTGGIFFDDLELSDDSLDFTKGIVNTWMPSWIPIVQKHVKKSYSEQQKQWQLLRRGRYLEFNLLYDRGVKFGLANANPRVEGVMVSAPPLIAYEYNHQVAEGSPEAELVQVLKEPRDWVSSNA